MNMISGQVNFAEVSRATFDTGTICCIKVSHRRLFSCLDALIAFAIVICVAILKVHGSHLTLLPAFLDSGSFFVHTAQGKHVLENLNKGRQDERALTFSGSTVIVTERSFLDLTFLV
jgi:hypothetical protein